VTRLWLLLAALLWPLAAQAHESRPALLTITESTGGTIEVTFREPLEGEGMAIELTPRLSSGWLDRAPDRMVEGPAALDRLWLLREPAEALAGQEVTVEGLETTLLDVLVTVERPGLARQSVLLTPASPTTTLGSAGNGLAGGLGWLRLGVDHILSGYDHLAFVLALMLLVRRWRGLLLALTSFTLAHSLTLALATLGHVDLPARPVEAAIALSIAVLAVEAVQEGRGESGWLRGRPWLMAFPFGLLHGLGFAGALGEMGLDPDHVAWPLAWFNLGVEAGQLLFVAGVLALAWLAGRISGEWLARVRRALPYAVGPLAMFWLIQRLAIL